MQLAALSLAAALQSGCFATSAFEATHVDPTGTVEIVSPIIGNHTFTPTGCVSGERQIFLGGDFEDTSSNLVLRLFVEPSGEASIRIFPADRPLEPGLLFGKADCGRFQLSLDRTGWQVNDIYDLAIRLELSCSTTNGDTAEGSLTVDHCH